MLCVRVQVRGVARGTDPEPGCDLGERGRVTIEHGLHCCVEGLGLGGGELAGHGVGMCGAGQNR